MNEAREQVFIEAIVSIATTLDTIEERLGDLDKRLKNLVRALEVKE